MVVFQSHRQGLHNGITLACEYGNLGATKGCITSRNKLIVRESRARDLIICKSESEITSYERLHLLQRTEPWPRMYTLDHLTGSQEKKKEKKKGII